MSVQLLTGDCHVVCPTLERASFDSVVTDPPYELGFMGKKWDSSGVSFDPATWSAVLGTMKPGAYLLAFGGTRTYHRMACAIEDAGLEIHDSIHWFFGSGFPKHQSKLKPGHEPIVLARRPAPVATPLQIDACRISDGGDPWVRQHDGSSHMHGNNYGNGRRGEASAQRRYGENGATSFNPTPGQRGGSDLGRWPANVILDEDAALELDEQTGTLTSGANPARRGSPKTRNTYGVFEGQEECVVHRGANAGGASRFYYVAKASRAERDFGCEALPSRNHHPTVKPLSLMRWLTRLVTPAGGRILDPFAGSGSTALACIHEGFDCVAIERELPFIDIMRARCLALDPSAEIAA